MHAFQILRVDSHPIDQELRDDAAIATNTDATEAEQNDARFVTGSRAIRMREEAVKAGEDVAKIGKGANTAWEFVSNIWTWFT